MHKRQQIRERLKTEIEALTNVDVYLNRVHAISSDKAVLIYPESEAISYDTIGSNRHQTRESTIRIEVAVKSKINTDNKIDDIMADIEPISGSNLNGLVRDLTLSDVTFEYSGEAETPVGAGILTINVVYTTYESLGD